MYISFLESMVFSEMCKFLNMPHALHTLLDEPDTSFVYSIRNLAHSWVSTDPLTVHFVLCTQQVVCDVCTNWLLLGEVGTSPPSYIAEMTTAPSKCFSKCSVFPPISSHSSTILTSLTQDPTPVSLLTAMIIMWIKLVITHVLLRWCDHSQLRQLEGAAPPPILQQPRLLISLPKSYSELVNRASKFQ